MVRSAQIIHRLRTIQRGIRANALARRAVIPTLLIGFTLVATLASLRLVQAQPDAESKDDIAEAIPSDNDTIEIGKEIRRVIPQKLPPERPALFLKTGRFADKENTDGPYLSWTRLAGIPGDHAGIVTHGVAIWSGPENFDLWQITDPDSLPEQPDRILDQSNFFIGPLSAPAGTQDPKHLPSQHAFKTTDGDLGILEITRTDGLDVVIRYKFLAFAEVRTEDAPSVDPPTSNAVETGVIHGILQIGREPMPHAEVILTPQFEGGTPERQHTHGEGRFVFGNLVPGWYHVGLFKKFIERTDRWQSEGYTSSHIRFVHLEPKEVASVEIGGTGRRVIGRLVTPVNGAPFEIAWQGGSTRRLYTVWLRENPPEGFTQEEQQAWNKANWLDPVIVYIDVDHDGVFSPDKDLNLRERSAMLIVDIEPDGAFSVNDVPPGTYRLNIDVNNHKHDRINPPIAEANQVINVPRGEYGSEYDVGEIPIKLSIQSEPEDDNPDDTAATEPVPLLEFHWVVDTDPPAADASRVEMKTRDGELETLYLEPQNLFARWPIKSAATRINPEDPNEIRLILEFTDEASDRLYHQTAANIGRRLAILYKGEVLSAATVRKAVRGSVIIGTDFSNDEAQRAVQALNGLSPAGDQYVSIEFNLLRFSDRVEKSLRDALNEAARGRVIAGEVEAFAPADGDGIMRFLDGADPPAELLLAPRMTILVD